MNTMNKAGLWIESELETSERMRTRFMRRLNKLMKEGAELRLGIQSVKGRDYYAEVWVENGDKKSRYLGTGDNKEVRDAQEVRFLKKAVEMLDERIAVLEKSVKMLKFDNCGIGRIDLIKVNKTLPKAYRLSPEYISEITGPDEGEKWYETALQEKAVLDKLYPVSYPYKRIHRAKDGTLTRSKSEMTIANELLLKEVPYIYEMPIVVGHIIMHPDFMFYSYSRRKAVMWEHVGMLGDEEYKEDFSGKIDNYIRGGLTPCVDVLLSFDTRDGRIDTRVIDEMIEEYR